MLKSLSLFTIAAFHTPAPQILDLWMHVADIAEDEGQYDQCLAALTKCIKVNPSDTRQYVRKINIHLMQHDIDKAKKVIIVQ